MSADLLALDGTFVLFLRQQGNRLRLEDVQILRSEEPAADVETRSAGRGGSSGCRSRGVGGTRHHDQVGISDKDRKILWARSGNRCALCRRVLVADRTMLDEEAIVGDEAHIAGRSQGGPRHGECEPGMVDRYDNLILLCRVDHKKVDDQPLHYTVSRLKQFKSQHEAWVERALGKVPASIRFHLDSDSAALHAEGVRIDVNLPNRIFAVSFGKSTKRFKVPDEYDVRISDMRQIFDAAQSVAGVERHHWWELHHNRRAERDRFTTSRFSLVYAGDLDFGDCYVEWLCDSEGYERGNGFRGDGQEDGLGGIIAEQPMHGLSYDLAHREQNAIDHGYSLIGDWYLRVLEDEDVDVLVQARISALWSKPQRWQAVPLEDE